jgi:hypothetical protein
VLHSFHSTWTPSDSRRLNSPRALRSQLSKLAFPIAFHRTFTAFDVDLSLEMVSNPHRKTYYYTSPRTCSMEWAVQFRLFPEMKRSHWGAASEIGLCKSLLVRWGHEMRGASGTGVEDRATLPSEVLEKNAGMTAPIDTYCSNDKPHRGTLNSLCSKPV